MKGNRIIQSAKAHHLPNLFVNPMFTNIQTTNHNIRAMICPAIGIIINNGKNIHRPGLPALSSIT